MSSLFVFDGMNRPSFTIRIDVERATVADLFSAVADSYAMELNGRRNLRIIFADTELKYSRRKKLCDVGIINHSTIAVIFRLPDRHPTAPATTTENADVADNVENESAKTDEDAEYAKEVKTDEENKDTREVKADEENKDVKEVKADEENKDAKEVKADEENKDVKEVKADEENKDAKEVKADEEKKFMNEVSVAVSEPVQIDEDVKDANEFSVAIKTGEAPPILEGTDIERSTNGGVETEENRPVLQRLPGVIELAFLPDFLNFDFDEERALLLCCQYHVMGSETMRIYCQKQIDTGNTNVACPYPLFPSLHPCPTVWKYRLVRHVACFTTKEMHNTEKAIAINLIGKDSTTLTCPRCFTWCSKMDPNMTRLRCFWCTRETGKEFIFCGYCLGQWENARSGKCANPECRSIEKTLDILRNSPVTNLYGGTWPTMRLCPRCGILTEFMGLCSQVHCQLCGYDYCFLCLKGATSKAQLQCIPYESSCQRASLQTSIPEWDGHNSD